MKPTQIAELFANIRTTIVSFFSILMFVALGVGIFAGIYWMAPALQKSADTVFEKGAFHHFQIQFPYGLTDNDIVKLQDVEGVTDAEGSYQAFVDLNVEDGKRTVKVQSLGERINMPYVVEGTLPTKAGEIALKASSAQGLGLGVGDTLTFAHDSTNSDDKDGMELLTSDAFAITALVESPEYLAYSSQTYGYSPTGRVDALAWAPVSAFDSSAYQEAYPIVNVRCDSLASLNSFGDEYDQKSSPIASGLSELGSTLAPARYDEIHDKAQKQVEDGEAQLAEAKKKIADGEKQVRDGEAQLAQARIDLDKAVADGEAKLAEAHEKLQSGEKAMEKAKNEFAAAEKKVAAAEDMLHEVDTLKSEGISISKEMRSYKKKQDKLLADGKISQKKYDARLDEKGKKISDEILPVAKRVDKGVPDINHNNYADAIATIDAIVGAVDNVPITVEGKTMTIKEATKELKNLLNKLSSAQSQLNKKSNELANGWDQYYAGQNELEAKKAEGEQKIADGEAEIKKAKEQIEKGKAEIAEKEPLLEEAKEKVASLKKYDWTVTSRSYNGGVVEISTFSDVTNHLSFSMAALFVIVGLLVSYSAMSRIVREQITQIGTKKALGLRSREITASFLAYAALAVIFGAIVGLIVGVIAVEGIVGKALSGRFIFGLIPPYFDWKLALLATGIELVLILGTAWLSCRTILKEQAIELLKGEKPPVGKTRFFEKWGLWQKMPLYTQTIVNNCMNDKKRIFSTVVGVAGCTALVVTAITLNNDVMASYDKHYERVYGFDTITLVDANVEGSADAVAQALEGKGCTSTVVLRKTMALQLPDGDLSTVRVISPSDEESFGNLYHINPVQGAEVDLSADGVWMSQAYASHIGAKVGDEVKVNASDGSVRALPIAGFYEFYLTYNELVIGREAYERVFETKLAPNAVLSNVGQASFEEAKATASAVKGFSSISDDKTSQYSLFANFSSVSGAVVLIYLALSVLMAIVVLLNLNIMFIDEKKRELIVLMINGFSVKNAKRYIYNDTIVLTIIGIIIGLVLGAVMGSVTVGSIEPMTAFFFKGINWPALGIATATSIVLATIMSIIALHRIPAFNLTDINRL